MLAENKRWRWDFGDARASTHLLNLINRVRIEEVTLDAETA